jgi:DNA-binding NarL/FixJ family response regulator
LLLLTHEDGPQLEAALAAGAAGYMLKTSSPRQILAALQQVSLPEDQDPKGISKGLPDLKALANSNQADENAPPLLTPREEEVAGMLAEGRPSEKLPPNCSLASKPSKHIS